LAEGETLTSSKPNIDMSVLACLRATRIAKPRMLRPDALNKNPRNFLITTVEEVL
jgi:hypothetical protein